MKIKKGDTVEVITGNDRGKRGEVVRALPKQHKIVVRGVNVVKKHAKQRRQNLRATQTGLVELEMPIDVSNVKLVTPAGKITRVNYREEQGVLKRYSNKYDEIID
ncbi:MAG: 50S ribosomal protein L24 [Anaerolineae bacterium]|nr:50S ribosomal protein L24 [Thermoflexales bacterium]MDW8408460.1 50S ribosomal protein L24 [Anaerolineae bacterium]